MMKKVLLALVKFYRVAISPYRPPCCRYIPTWFSICAGGD